MPALWREGSQIALEKKNKIDEILNDLQDLIDMLKQQVRCQDPKARNAWMKKHEGVKARMNELSADEFREAEVRWKKMIGKNEYSNIVRSTY